MKNLAGHRALQAMPGTRLTKGRIIFRCLRKTFVRHEEFLMVDHLLLGLIDRGISADMEAK